MLSGDDIHPFFAGESARGNVVFNFRGSAVGDLAAFAAGYHEAGRALVERLATEPGYYDYEGYPVLFLYRHSLELYMKAILYRGATMHGLISESTIDVERLFARHDLSGFLPAMREVFDDAGWRGPLGLPDLETWDDFCKLVRAIESVDRGSYAFRYPITKKLEAAVPQHLVLNVISFGRHMDPVLDLLDGAESGLEDMGQYSAEAAHFLKQLAKEWRDDAL